MLTETSLLLLSGLIALLAMHISRPMQTLLGFALGMIASELHLLVILVHATLMYFVCMSEAGLLLTPLALASYTCCAICYCMLLHDFFHGLQIPLPRITPFKGTGKKEGDWVRQAGQSVWFKKVTRFFLLLCPPLIYVYGWLFNKHFSNIHYTEDRHNQQVLDVIVSRRKDKREQLTPVMLYIHGGAWIMGDKLSMAFPLIQMVPQDGWIVVTMDYRLSNIDGTGAVWPDHIIDVKRAICWVKANIAQYGGDPSAIVVCGGSAGGHLAALAATTPNKPEFQPGFELLNTTVQGCIDIYGALDLTNQEKVWHNLNRFWRSFYLHYSGYKRKLKHPIHKSASTEFLERAIMKQSFEENPQLFHDASPITYIKANGCNVPFLIVHGTQDILVPLHEPRLGLKHLPEDILTYYEIEGAHHCFDLFPNPRCFLLVDLVDEWLHQFSHALYK